MIVGYLAETVPRRIMATGLSVEVQLRTLLMSGMAPLLGLASGSHRCEDRARIHSPP